MVEARRALVCVLLKLLPSFILVADGNAAVEFPRFVFPPEGSQSPDTYLGSSSKIACVELQELPPGAPYDPTAEEAMAFCSTQPGCGGFLYTTTQASTAQGGSGLREVAYCEPQSWTTGAEAADTAVGFERFIYSSCDVKVKLTEKTSHFHGVLSASRGTCVRLGRGIGSGGPQQVPPRPNKVLHRSRPKMMVQISGVDYEVGREIFRSASEAASLSADASSHMMQTAAGVQYYMPGASHAERDQPFALDGYYPLYETQAGAQYHSIRAGGNGDVRAMGPMTSSGVPAMWPREPYTQTYWMPDDGVQLFLGNYVAPFAHDGYFPLYRSRADAELVSTNGVAQSHGPGSDTGHPLWWSTGEYELLYMPESGPDKFYGDYVQPGQKAAPAPYGPVLPVYTGAKIAPPDLSEA